MSAAKNLPALFVEGKDDVSVISALLHRHGIDTDQGRKHLFINDQGSDDNVLSIMPVAITNASDRPVGFVLDIDVEIANRWDAVRGRLNTIGITAPEICPTTGYFGKIPEYPCRFGIWLMPDCSTDCAKLENLCQSLIHNGDPLWPHAQASVSQAASIIDEANRSIVEEFDRWSRFRDIDRIKSEIHTWLAWQLRPGAPLGAAINAEILGDDSAQAIAFLRWLKELYGFQQLTDV